jgi:hypothetical protein
MDIEEETKIILSEPGSRPPYYKIADHLWGEGANIDSDGNSESAEDTNWTELSICHRDDDSPYIHIDPVSEDPLILEISSTSNELAKKTAEFLASETGGVLKYDNA